MSGTKGDERGLFQHVAVIDLGSNSFHLLVARERDGQVTIVDRLREQTALAEDQDRTGRIGDGAFERSIDCLRRFAQRLWGVPRSNVRIVGTNTLRRAKNARSFLSRAAKVLGHPVEVVSGNEEARLIYVGVAHGLAESSEQRLVVDIGGGSTECILGQGFEVARTDSLQMGCVVFTQRFFADGRISKGNLRRAVMAAQTELEPIQARYRTLGWERCIGSSGTIVTTEKIVRAKGWAENGIDAPALERLCEWLREQGEIPKLDLPELSPERARVYPGGVAILKALFDSYRIKQMTVSNQAMREGLLYDLIGRLHHEDIRNLTISRFVERYHVDLSQASRVERTALLCLKQVAPAWGIDEGEARRFLIWAARLHEIGLSLSYSGYHRHSAYLIKNSDMPGFSREDQDLLAALALNHRRKIRMDAIEELTEDRRLFACRLCVLLRIAVCANRGRNSAGTPPMKLRTEVKDETIELRLPGGWLDKRPLTRVDLEEEATRLNDIGVKLVVEES